MTLAKALVPSQSLVTRALMVLGGSLFIALAAQVQVPMIPVPMTLQTLAVLIVGLTYGARLGALTLVAYLAEGLMGLPVFAGGMNAIAFAGPTAGFLVGFVGMAAIAGYAADRGVKGLVPTALVSVLASALLYVPGVAWAMSLAKVAGRKVVTIEGLSAVLGFDDLSVAEFLEQVADDAPHGREIVDYEELDLARIADFLGLSPERVITLHSETLYTIYAIGFCPGFPYLGYLPPELTGVPRLPAPRLRVEPGSVGLTAKQTGLYPLARPGGWNILGRTPLTLVDVAAGYFPLNVGEQVKFERIDQAEFERLKGERL